MRGPKSRGLSESEANGEKVKGSFALRRKRRRHHNNYYATQSIFLNYSSSRESLSCLSTGFTNKPFLSFLDDRLNQAFNFHLSPRLCPATAGCSPPSMVSIDFCCFPVLGGSILPCYVVLPSSAWSSPWSLPSPWLHLMPVTDLICIEKLSLGVWFCRIGFKKKIKKLKKKKNIYIYIYIYIIQKGSFELRGCCARKDVFCSSRLSSLVQQLLQHGVKCYRSS